MWGNGNKKAKMAVTGSSSFSAWLWSSLALPSSHAVIGPDRPLDPEGDAGGHPGEGGGPFVCSITQVRALWRAGALAAPGGREWLRSGLWRAARPRHADAGSLYAQVSAAGAE